MAAFTTIATAAGLAISAGTAGASFAQASKQNKMQQKAQREAKKAMAEARKQLGTNYYEGLSIQKEPFELAREALLSSGQQALQVAQEGETRGAAATAGRVAMAQQQGQRKIAGAMGQQMMALEQLAAQEESRLAGVRSGLDLSEAEGAQMAAREAERRKQAATQQGAAGLASVGQQAAQLAPLFGKAPTTFDPTGASFEEVQATFNPTLESMQTTIGPDGRISPGVVIPSVQTFEPQGLVIIQPNPFIPQISLQ